MKPTSSFTICTALRSSLATWNSTSRWGNDTSMRSQRLKSLDRFLSQFPRASQDLTAETFHAWCQSQSELTPRVRRYRMLMIRKFCLYRRRTVPDCFVPDPILFPMPGQTVTPYIFSEVRGGTADEGRIKSSAATLFASPS